MQTNNAVSVSPEIKALFEGMTYSFTGADGKSYQTIIEAGEPKTYIMVATHDGTLARRCDCTPVLSGTSWRTNEAWYTAEQLEEAEENYEVVYIEGRSEYWERDCAVYCDEEDCYIHEEDAIEIGGYYYHTDSDSIRYDHRGDVFHAEDGDYIYIDSEGEYYHNSECHWSEEDDEYHVGEDECNCDRCTPIENRINEYHHSPRPSLFRGVSPYLVGFEVEKCSVGGASSRGDYVETRPLFSGWETDASCGVEGITHAYDPLDPVTVAKFGQDLLDSADYVNEDCDNSCGGHINLSSTAHTPRELMASFKNYAPLWYAVYRHRLNNNYCHNDKKIEHGGDKYSPVRTKSFGIEIRLPNRVHNVVVLHRRFEWMGITCQAMSNQTSFNAYVKSCRSLLLDGAYNGDRAKYAMILRLARKFRIWMLDGIAHESIQKWA